MLSKLRQNELDLVFAALPVTGESFETAPLFEEPFMAVFPRNHPLTQRKTLTMEDLASDHDENGLLLLEDGHCLRDQALSVCGMVPMRDQQRLATSLEMLWHMIGAGEGYSLIPQLALRNRAEWEELVVVRPMAPASRQIGLVWRSSDPRGSAFRDFAAFLASKLPESCLPVTVENT